MTTPSIMEQLKTETWPLHQQAENGALEKDLIKGALPQDVYRDQLAQRYLIHGVLESRLRDARALDHRIAAVVQDYQFHEIRAAEDLRFYGGDPEQATPCEATKKVISAIQTADAVALLGFQYVFEGSNNGARFIAMALRKAWDLQGDDGTRYLDPYGKEQRSKWADFKTAMDQQEFTPEESAQIVDAAKATFLQIIEVETELYPLVCRLGE